MLQRKGQNISKIVDRSSPPPVHSQVTGVAIAAAASVLVRRISVGIEEDTAFGVVRRLTGAEDANFKFITSSSGAKVFLNGRGSPHPQPRSFEQEPLTVCIRAKTNTNLEEAIALVEDLLSDIRLEYQEIHHGCC